MPVQVLKLRGLVLLMAALVFATLSMVTPASAADSVDERIFEHAGRLLLEGRSDLAMDEYRRLVDSYPRSLLVDDALLAMGSALYKVTSLKDVGRARGEKTRDAYRVFDRIRREHPQGNAAPEAIVRMALLRLEPYALERDIEAARALFRSVSEIYPESEWVDDARLGMAFCSRLEEDPAQVVADLQPFWEVLAASPLRPRAQLWRAQAFEALGRRDRALELYQRVREQAPGSAVAARAEGRALGLLRRTLAGMGEGVRLMEDAGFEGRVGEVREVTGVWASPQGWIYLSDGGAGRIVRLDRHGRNLGHRPAAKPALLAFDPYGQAAVLEASALRLGKKRWDLAAPRGNKLSRLRPAAAPMPRNDTSWWFVDERGDTVLEFDGALGFQRVVWKGENFSARRARAGVQGSVWLLDVKGRQLARLDRRGEALRIDLSAEPVSLRRPVDLAVDTHGAVWVLDAQRSAVAIFSPAGEYEGFVQLQGVRKRSLLEAVDVDASGALLVYDARERRVRRFLDPPAQSAATKRAER